MNVQLLHRRQGNIDSRPDGPIDVVEELLLISDRDMSAPDAGGLLDERDHVR